MIERAKQDCAQTQKPRFSVCDGIFTGLDHTVDGIVCSSVVEYVDDPGALLRCFAASLKKGGTLLLSFANRRSLWGLYSRLRNRNTAPHFQVQKHIWSFRQCRVVLEKAGFTLTEPVEYFESPLDPYPLMRPIARTALFGTLGLVVGKML
jgi:SAM-dependent methyltransferase